MTKGCYKLEDEASSFLTTALRSQAWECAFFCYLIKWEQAAALQISFAKLVLTFNHHFHLIETIQPLA
ncbi:hypothetical protein AAHA92_05820 [Salvia divinorum]|uniref:Uncharacterized protein n=1 Tax=Salvia divinorum TaxID=28513 RepID=A0ABD1I3N6_SALDI